MEKVPGSNPGRSTSSIGLVGNSATPSEVGAQAELAVATALAKAGRLVFVPFFSPHSRVDLVYLDDLGRARRVQCKTSQLVGGRLTFWVCSNTGNKRKDYRGDVDEFGVYSAALGQVYLVPVNHVPATQACLRLEPTRNGQGHGVRWAANYLLGPP